MNGRLEYSFVGRAAQYILFFFTDNVSPFCSKIFQVSLILWCQVKEKYTVSHLYYYFFMCSSYHRTDRPQYSPYMTFFIVGMVKIHLNITKEELRKVLQHS